MDTKRTSRTWFTFPFWAVSARSGAVQSLFEICVEKNETDRASESGSLCALCQPQILRFNGRPSAVQPAGLNRRCDLIRQDRPGVRSDSCSTTAQSPLHPPALHYSHSTVRPQGMPLSRDRSIASGNVSTTLPPRPDEAGAVLFCMSRHHTMPMPCMLYCVRSNGQEEHPFHATRPTTSCGNAGRRRSVFFPLLPCIRSLSASLDASVPPAGLP